MVEGLVEPMEMAAQCSVSVCGESDLFYSVLYDE